MTRGRRVRTSVLRRVDWEGYAEYRGTLTTLVPDPFVPGRELYCTFDAYFTLGYGWLRVMNERPGWA
ncbi:hypothetical protein SEA_SBLACKBERRY_57 [Microbacterium phage SBlackberry]|nr:hypothetical protein SEA_SBLACKBERRY_57 [Microbacterium phage SBlackberry]